MQIFIYCKVTLHVSGVTAPIIRSTKNCNRSLRLQFLVLLMMGSVTPETCNSDFAVNKYLHTVASGWIFIKIAETYYRISVMCQFTPSVLQRTSLHEF